MHVTIPFWVGWGEFSAKSAGRQLRHLPSAWRFLHGSEPRLPAVRRDAAVGAFGDKAVDMTLRLDNARALPTCPQPQQLQQTALIVA